MLHSFPKVRICSDKRKHLQKYDRMRNYSISELFEMNIFVKHGKCLVSLKRSSRPSGQDSSGIARVVHSLTFVV